MRRRLFLIAHFVLEPLAGECVLEMSYRNFEGGLPRGKRRLPSEHLGMGTRATWHGSPDARCYTVNLVSSSDYDCLSTWERSSMTVDGKYKSLGIQGLNQVTAHAVVSSFIHKNKFEGYNHLVPAILINTVDLALAFYDAETDVLIHVLPLPWRDRNGLKIGRVCLLWMALHFMLFLKPIPTEWQMRSGLQAILEHSRALSDYEALESTAVHYWVESGFPEPQKRTQHPPLSDDSTRDK